MTHPRRVLPPSQTFMHHVVGYVRCSQRNGRVGRPQRTSSRRDASGHGSTTIGRSYDAPPSNLLIPPVSVRIREASVLARRPPGRTALSHVGGPTNFATLALPP